MLPVQGLPARLGGKGCVDGLLHVIGAADMVLAEGVLVVVRANQRLGFARAHFLSANHHWCVNDGGKQGIIGLLQRLSLARARGVGQDGLVESLRNMKEPFRHFL